MFEALLVYLILLFVVGPGIVLYGIVIAVRERVRLTRRRELHGGKAIFAGLVTEIIGISFTYLLWWMTRYFPH